MDILTAVLYLARELLQAPDPVQAFLLLNPLEQLGAGAIGASVSTFIGFAAMKAWKWMKDRFG